MENRIRAFRKAADLRQEDLARELGVTRQTINAIENNKYDPTLALAMKLARLLGQPVEELLLLPKCGLLPSRDCDTLCFAVFRHF